MNEQNKGISRRTVNIGASKQSPKNMDPKNVEPEKDENEVFKEEKNDKEEVVSDKEYYALGEDKPVLPAFMRQHIEEGASPVIEEIKLEKKKAASNTEETKKSHKFGEVVASETVDTALMTKDIDIPREVTKINSEKFFSEGHKESVEKHNDLAENASSKNSVLSVSSSEEFLELFNKKFEGVEILSDDSEYATAAARPIVGASLSSYSVIMLHSGYKANFSALHFLDKSRININTEDQIHDRERLFRTIYEKISFMTCGKPSFEKWQKMTALRDLEPALYGIYSATYPTSQPFDVTCPKCQTKISVNTDPETILAVYDEDAYNQVNEIICSASNTQAIIENSALAKTENIPFSSRKTVLIFREPSLWDYLETLRFIEKNKQYYEDYDKVFENVLFLSAVMYIDVAFLKRTGKTRFVKSKDKAIISNIIATMDDEEEELFNKQKEKFNTRYDVRFEIPKFKCAGVLKDKNGNLTSNACSNEIGPLPLDMESILFFRMKKSEKKEEEQ